MKWGSGRRSDNVEDDRGSGGGVGRLGIGGVAVVVVISLLLGKNPIEMLGLVSQIAGGVAPQAQQAPPANDQAADFVRAVLGETEDVWGQVFQKSGKTYEQPKLILFAGSVNTACGGASAASGPFYCPGDHRVYIDLSFFDEMKTRLGGGGDFANAYVIAHEVGHHVQSLLGISNRVARARQQGQSIEGASGLSVRQELQADCFAGVWANLAQQHLQWMENGDVESALNTATAIGDDRLQKQSRGTVVPDSFTHGSSEQRVRWFRAGLDSGNPSHCDTFNAKAL